MKPAYKNAENAKKHENLEKRLDKPVKKEYNDKNDAAQLQIR